MVLEADESRTDLDCEVLMAQTHAMSKVDAVQPLPISAVMICGDEHPLLQQCIESLADLGEVCIYFNGEHATEFRQAVAGFSNVVVHEGPFVGFGPSKQRAVSLAGNDWVLSIDSDEWLDSQLRDALRQITLDDHQTAYEVLRKNRFMGVHVARGGWGNDHLLRLFHRDTARFNDKPVHEKVEVNTGVSVEMLSGTLWHEAVTDIDQFLQKISRYSTLNAAQKSRSVHPVFALLRAQFAFFRSYVLQLGVLAGWRGLVIAYARGVGTFFKYVKRFARPSG